jgi:hypothetical protein
MQKAFDPKSGPPELTATEALERKVDEVIAICGGDVRAALRATLLANLFLTAEVERFAHAVSFGIMRGRTSAARRGSEKLDDWREISSGGALEPE